jgi:ribosomal protein L11 methyltransferase
MATDKMWQQVTLRITREAEEMATDILFDLGATGTVMLEESPEEITLAAYFDESANPEEIVERVEAAFAQAGERSALRGIVLSELADQDWMQKWKEGFGPLTIGSRLLIAPSWKLPAETGGRAVIQIDPGMAFGTGTHETTRLCLEAIERYWDGGTMLDVGTGTGILAIAAALLVPASLVTAIDIDPLAVEVARENIAVNEVSKRITVLEATPDRLVGSDFDVVVANLTAEVIIELIEDLSGCLRPAGAMILSGILTTLRDDVEQHANNAGLEIIERGEAGEWSLLVARRGQR